MSAMNAIEKGLPTNVDAERFVLGSILLDDALYVQAAGTLEADDFSLEKHRRIFKRMGELQERAEKIDRITVANELMKFNELEACDGLSYLVCSTMGFLRSPTSTPTSASSRIKPFSAASFSPSQNMMNRALMAKKSPGHSGRRRRDPPQAGRGARQNRPRQCRTTS